MRYRFPLSRRSSPQANPTARQIASDTGQIWYTFTGQGATMVQEILGVISPVGAKWGARMSPAVPKLFLYGIPGLIRHYRLTLQGQRIAV